MVPMKTSILRLILLLSLAFNVSLFAEEPAVTQSTDPNYVLQPNDYLKVTVYQEDDLTTSTRVSPKGNISMPLIGDVKVGGLKVSEARDLVSKDLMDGYLKNPQVSITMIEFATRRYSVLGQVQKPGSFEIPQQEQVTLLDALALAGGFTETANRQAVSVRRSTDDANKEQILTLDAVEMAKQPSQQPFFVQPGDVITVTEASKRMFSVLGQVQRPGSFDVPLETQVTILDAIAEAGGYTPDGNREAVIVRRNTDGVENIFTINAQEMAKEPSHKPFFVLPGDVVTVNEASKRLFSVLGEVQRPGSYEMPLETSVTILDAIAQAGGFSRIANPSKVNVRRKVDGKDTIIAINAKAIAKDSSKEAFYIQPGDVITVTQSIF